MGTQKAALEWHGSTLLRHVTGVVDRAVDGRVVVVRAPGQSLPDLPATVMVREDPEEGNGPMQGVAVGLAAAAAFTDTAFVCSTDLPFLHVAFVRAVLRGFEASETCPAGGRSDVALPVVDGYRQPLLAGYRTGLAATVEELLEAGLRGSAPLFERCRVHELDEEALLADPQLARLDPELASVVNVNEPEDYRAARARPAPEVYVEGGGAPTTEGGGGEQRAVEAASVGAAAGAIGLALDDRVVVVINGVRVDGDPLTPLVTGDRVRFLPADADG